jgi:threonylcarbamoyladenosine tRNA methylthiotransferase CDKAL1
VESHHQFSLSLFQVDQDCSFFNTTVPLCATMPSAVLDIEEIGVEISDLDREKTVESTQVVRKFVKQPKEETHDLIKSASVDHFLPGSQTIWVKTWGCAHNNSDGEYMAGLLADQGYRILLEDAKKGEADVWLLNSCTVKGPSEQTFVNEINKAKEQGKQVVVAGCVPQASPNGQHWNGLSIIGVG